ncbi:MAG: hypothetical protein J7L11_08590 [Thermoprotei archaeon]|nr:hypothetical protein [Thermoprotei archaeon]
MSRISMVKGGRKYCEVNPAFSLQDAELIAKKLRLDVHTASARILAYRYLKSTNDHQHL